MQTRDHLIKNLSATDKCLKKLYTTSLQILTLIAKPVIKNLSKDLLILRNF
jgi:hypothetical protein